MLEPLPPVRVDAVELVTVDLALSTPLRTAAGTRDRRTVLLVHVLADASEGWAECTAEADPTYAPEFTDGARLTLRDHLIPRAWAGPMGDAAGLGPHLDAVRGHSMARSALELAVLDAQLRGVGRSLADWLGATARGVPAGAALGLHVDLDGLLTEADAALAAGAARLRVKIAPGSAAVPLRALRTHVGDDVPLQADANGTFSLAEVAHVAELHELDEIALACLEQPLAPDDLVGHAALARELATPICLDEALTSVGALDAAVALGACEVACLKPSRVGGWLAARQFHDRCVELGVPVWVGGMLETAVGRSANLAVTALPGMTLAPDLDPRGRYDPDLAATPLPGADGLVPVPDGPGAGAAPDADALVGAEVLSCPR